MDFSDYLTDNMHKFKDLCNNSKTSSVMTHAIKIGEVVKLDNPNNPKKVIKDFHAPQNFMYVDIDFEKLSV